MADQSSAEAHQAVRKLLAQFWHRLDDGDYAGAAACFASDGIWWMGERELRGRSAIEEFFAGVGPQPIGTHVFSNVVVDLDADGTRATVLSDFVHFAAPDAHSAAIATTGGRYEDVVVVAASAWHFAERRAHFRWKNW